MSKEYMSIENDSWETVFLAGAADVLSERLDSIMDYPNNVDADVFYVKDNDLSLLNDSVKRRLKYYKQYNSAVCGESDDDDPEDEINALDFHLTEVKTDVHSYICEKLRPYCSSDKLSDEVKNFLDYMSRRLKEPLCIYQPASMPRKPGFADKTDEILGYTYLYAGFEHFFISYKDHLVLFIIGSIE